MWQIASILALILAWVYIFDTVLKEREKLESPQEGIVGAVPRDVENPVAPGQTLPANGTGRAAGARQVYQSNDLLQRSPAILRRGAPWTFYSAEEVSPSRLRSRLPYLNTYLITVITDYPQGASSCRGPQHIRR